MIIINFKDFHLCLLSRAGVSWKMTQLRSFLRRVQTNFTIFFLLWICFRYEAVQKREKKMKWRKNAPENTKKKVGRQQARRAFLRSFHYFAHFFFESNTLEFVDEKHDSKAINFIIITFLRSLVALSCCPHVDYLFSRGRTRACVAVHVASFAYFFVCAFLAKWNLTVKATNLLKMKWKMEDEEEVD